MKQKVLLILSLAIVLVIAAGFFVVNKDRFWPGLSTSKTTRTKPFEDPSNKLKLSYPETWSVISTNGYVHVMSVPDNPDALNVVIGTNPVKDTLDAVGFNNANNVGIKEIQIGDKTLKLLQQSAVIPGTQRISRVTHLLWQDTKQSYWVQVNPGYNIQSGDEVYKIIQSLQSL